MSALELIAMHAKLTQAVTDACVASLKAGMSKEDVMAVLARVQELLENAED